MSAGGVVGWAKIGWGVMGIMVGVLWAGSVVC